MHVVRDKKYRGVSYVMQGRREVEVHLDNPNNMCSRRRIVLDALEGERLERANGPGRPPHWKAKRRLW